MPTLPKEKNVITVPGTGAMSLGAGPSEEARLFRQIDAACALVEEVLRLLRALRSRVGLLEERRRRDLRQREREAKQRWREETAPLRRRLWRGWRAVAADLFVR